MRSILALAAAVAAIFSTVAPGIAGDQFFDLARTPVVVNNFVVGPGSIFFVGINPFRYPDWNVKVDDRLAAGPSAYQLQSVSGNPVSQTSTDSSATASAKDAPVAFIEPYSATPVSSAQQDACANLDKPTGNAINVCVAAIAIAEADAAKAIADQQNTLRKAVNRYNGLVFTADQTIGETGTIDTAAKFEQYRKAIRTKLFESPDGSDPDLGEHVNGEVGAVLVGTGRVKDWPQDKIQTAVAKINAARGYYAGKLRQAQPVDRSKDKDVQDVDKAKADFAKALAEFAKVQDELNPKIADMTDRAKTLAARDNTSSEAQLYTRKVQELRTLVAARVATVSVERFGYRDNVPCGQLAGGTREKIYTVTLFAGAASRVRVVCQARMFISGGVGFSGLSQPTFAAVPDKPLPTPVPVPGATTSPGPPASATIRATTSTSIRPTAIIMNNVLIGKPSDEDGLYASFGLGVLQTSTGELNADYLAGLSWSLSKTMLVTIGAQFGKTTQLAPGYENGTVIQPGQTPQTITRFTPKLFIGFTFGKQ